MRFQIALSNEGLNTKGALCCFSINKKVSQSFFYFVLIQSFLSDLSFLIASNFNSSNSISSERYCSQFKTFFQIYKTQLFTVKFEYPFLSKPLKTIYYPGTFSFLQHSDFLLKSLQGHFCLCKAFIR